jgi:hypothetical protein
MCHNELKLKLDVHLFGELNLNLNFRKPDPLVKTPTTNAVEPF